MKRFLTLMLAGLFTMSLVGCRAEAEIDEDDEDRSMKKTTRIERDGDRDRTVETETTIRRD